MNNIVLRDSFVAAGCAGKQTPQPAVTIEAGAMWLHAYDAVTNKAGRYVQGGGCTTVGVAGLIQEVVSAVFPSITVVLRRHCWKQKL
ncbi:MAG: hypothetical protein WKG06_47740 [Segetibacter sp.]